MKKISILFFIITFALSGLTQENETSIVINDTTWANCNVNVSGRFAGLPKSYGIF